MRVITSYANQVERAHHPSNSRGEGGGGRGQNEEKVGVAVSRMAGRPTGGGVCGERRVFETGNDNSN